MVVKRCSVSRSLTLELKGERQIRIGRDLAGSRRRPFQIISRVWLEVLRGTTNNIAGVLIGIRTGNILNKSQTRLSFYTVLLLSHDNLRMVCFFRAEPLAFGLVQLWLITRSSKVATEHRRRWRSYMHPPPQIYPYFKTENIPISRYSDDKY